MNTAAPQTHTGKAGTVLAIIVASYLMIVVDISIVITGLPRIQGIRTRRCDDAWRMDDTLR